MCTGFHFKEDDMNTIQVAIKNIAEVEAGLKEKQARIVKAVNATTSDFKSRGPGWISQEVTQVYAIKKKDVTQSKKGAKINGKVSVAGVKLNNVELQYRGSLLSPVHFKMTPKKRPEGKRYRVSVEIKKGSKTRLPKDVFLADNRGGTQIPFQREGPDRLPIRSVKSVSVPQMITNSDAAERINKRINTELDKRFAHNLERFSK